jgi:hypothetical protein
MESGDGGCRACHRAHEGRASEASEECYIEAKVDDITAELVRLLEEGSEPQPLDRAAKDKT